MKITIDHNGVEYGGQIGTIKHAFLGTEDHGIFSAMLHFEWPGGGIGAGGYGLDQWSEARKRRIGTGYGLDHIKAILETVGVAEWSQLVGKSAVVLFEPAGSWIGSMSVGIASLDGTRVLVFAEHFEQWKADHPDEVSR